MSVIKYLSRKFRGILAEVLNIPTAVGVLPAVPFATGKNEQSLLFIETTLATAALGFGAVFAPALTAFIGVPLFLVGRFMQGISHSPTPAQKLFGISRDGSEPEKPQSTVWDDFWFPDPKKNSPSAPPLKKHFDTQKAKPEDTPVNNQAPKPPTP